MDDMSGKFKLEPLGAKPISKADMDAAVDAMGLGPLAGMVALTPTALATKEELTDKEKVFLAIMAGVPYDITCSQGDEPRSIKSTITVKHKCAFVRDKDGRWLVMSCPD